jgi:hypothetical protein
MQRPDTTPVTISQEPLSALANRIRDAHQAVGRALGSVLELAMVAGDALIAAHDQVNHGEWGRWLRRNCELGGRTAQVYMQLARHRELIEANPQRSADLSLSGALRLIGDSKEAPVQPRKTGKPSSSSKLDTLAWSSATLEQRRHFLDGVGADTLIEAMPAEFLAGDRSASEQQADGQERAGHRARPRRPQQFCHP